MKDEIKNYILDCTKYENHYAVINKETGKEVFKISKKGNSIDDILCQFPELEIEEGQHEGRCRVEIVSDLQYVDGKWIDKNGVEYESDDEYYRIKNEKNTDQ